MARRPAAYFRWKTNAESNDVGYYLEFVEVILDLLESKQPCTMEAVHSRFVERCALGPTDVTRKNVYDKYLLFRRYMRQIKESKDEAECEHHMTRWMKAFNFKGDGERQRECRQYALQCLKIA